MRGQTDMAPRLRRAPASFSLWPECVRVGVDRCGHPNLKKQAIESDFQLLAGNDLALVGDKISSIAKT